MRNDKRGYVMTNEEKTLIEDNINVIHKCLINKGIYDEDIHSEAILYICERISYYDPKRGKISTYINTVVNNMLKNRLYLNDFDKRKIDHVYKESIDTTYDDNGNEIGGIDIPIPDKTNDIIQKECIEKVLNRLSKKSQDMFKLSLIGYNNKDIGNIMKCSKSYVGKVLVNTKRKMRKEYYGS